MGDEIKIGEKTVTVRQLSVREVNDYLEDKVDPPTVADLLMNRDIPERAVRLATGLTTEEINGDVKPSELEKLWNEVEAKNPFLAALLQRLMTAGERMLADMENNPSPEQNSEKQPAPLQEPVDTAG